MKERYTRDFIRNIPGYILTYYYSIGGRAVQMLPEEEV